MAVTIATAANYWISPTALSITLNALGEANRIQASVASGSAIVCYIRGIDGLGYDNGHNYRRWPLTIIPTYFDTNDEIYLYVAIPRSEAIGTDALVVFPRQLLDIEGYAVVTDPDTGEQTRGTKIGSDDYYFIWLQGIITSSGTGYTPREWREPMQTGTLATDEAIDSQEGTWYRWDPVSQTVTFLKEVIMDPATSWFRNLIARSFTLGGRTLNGVAVKGETPTDSDDTIVTPAYLEGIGDDKYLRKDQDDFTPYSLGVGGNLSVQGIFDAIEAKIDKMRSHNYSGSGLGDTGWLLTSDDGTGASLLEIDKLLVRMKATFMELEIRKETFSGGNNHYSPAGSVIYRVDFMTVDNQPLGYRVQKVPWLLKGIGWLFRMKSYTRQRRIRYAYTLDQLTDEERRQVAKFRCYLISDDGTTATRNWWQVGDQPRCQSFNKALSRDNKRNNIYDTTTAGVTDPTSPISSDFWWRLVTEAGTQILDDDKVYDFIEMPYEHYSAYEDEYRRNPDNFCAAGSDIPKAGDTIVCMGNRTDPARMNLVSIISVSTTDFGEAPAVKGYRGIHRFSLDGCLVFNISPAKVSIRSKSFEFLADNGDAFPVPLERGEWTLGLRYHWYDRVSHNGSIWLCQISDTKVWVNQAGNNIGTPATADIIEGEGEYTYTAGSAQIPSLEGDEVITGTDHYYRRGMVGSQMVYEVQAWTYDEPTDTNANWLKEVGKGTEITDSIIRYNASLSGTINPDDDPTGATHPSGWKETIAATGIKAGQYLWTRRTTYYSDNRTPTVEYSVARWGIDGDGISEIDSYYWATTEPITMTPAYDEAHILPWDASASQSAKKGMWAPTFSDLETVWGGIGKMQAMYVWEKTVIKYDMAPDPEGQPVTKPDLVSYQCNRIGNDGLIGEEEYYMLAESDDFATVFGSTTPAYAKIGIRWYNQTNPAAENYRLSDTQPNINTSMWSPLMPAYDKATHGAKIYLWNFEQRVDGTGTQYATRPVCIGNHARGIKGVRELYACSAFGVPQTGRQFPNDIYDASSQHPESDINVWTDEIYNRAPSEAYPYQWNWTRTLYSSPRGASDTGRDTATGYFYEDVFHVSAVRGTNGEDGAGEETIYKRNNTGTTPDTPPNSGKGTLGGVYKANWTAAEVAAGDDWVPDGWTDNPQGIDYSNQYEYESKRRLGSPDSQGRKQWGALSAPKLRSRWGRNGQDGDGTEYVFIRTKNNVAPTFAVNDGGNATDYKSQEWLPYINNKDACGAESNRCTDDPKDISREWPYEWCAKRTMADPEAQTGIRLWKSYYECTADNSHKMSLWKNYAEDGNGIESITDTFGISAYGTSSNENTPPRDISASSTSSTYGWSTSQIAPTDARPFIWKKEVTVFTDTSKNTTKYFCIGKKGDKGDSITGSPGHVGRFFYYAGEYDANTEYKFEKTQAPYVLYQGNFYMMDYAANAEYQQSSTTRTVTGVTPSNNGNPWTLMASTQQYYIAKAFFGEYAQLGAFIINKDWMISQYGTLIDSSGTETAAEGNPIKLFGNNIHSGTITVRVRFTASGTASITATASSESYDKGRVKTSGGTTLIEVGGKQTATKDQPVTSGDYIDLSYSKDSYVSTYDDMITFTVEGVSYTVSLVSATTGMTWTGTSSTGTKAYTYFDPTDPMASTPPSSGYKFRPNFAVDGKTGKTYQNDAVIRGRIEASEGYFKGNLYTPYFELTSSNIANYATRTEDTTYHFYYYDLDLLKTGLNLQIEGTNPSVNPLYINLPEGSAFLGAEANIMCTHFYVVVRNAYRMTADSSSYSVMSMTLFRPMINAGQKMKLKHVKVGSSYIWVIDSISDYQANQQPMMVAMGRTYVAYSNGSWVCTTGTPFVYNSAPIAISRTAEGKYRISITGVNISLSNCIISVYGIGYVWNGTTQTSDSPCKATLLSAGADYFDVCTSDDEESDDGEFGFVIYYAGRANKYVI